MPGYGEGMTDAGVTQAARSPIESVLAQELARGDAVLGALGPMLGMLYVHHDSAMFSDEVIARVRGMCVSVAREVLAAEASAAGHDDPYGYAREREDDLATKLAGHLPFLTHCHALAIEHRLATQLERRSAIDPVLSPMLQAAIADTDPQTASLAMALLAAQSRFMHQQARMELPLTELPQDLFHAVMAVWEGQDRIAGANAFEQARTRVQGARERRDSRQSMLARVASLDGQPGKHRLSLAHAGVALFLSALAIGAGQERDVATVATNESQLGRLALMLRAAGVKPGAIAEQFLLIHPDITLPDDFAALRADRAATLLDTSGRKELG